MLLGLFQSMSWLIRRANFIVRILDNKDWIKVWSEPRFVLPKDSFFSCIWMSYFRWTNSRRMSPGVSTSCWFFVDFSLFTTSRIITGFYVRRTIIDVMYLLKKVLTQVQLEILLAQLGNWRSLSLKARDLKSMETCILKSNHFSLASFIFKFSPFSIILKRRVLDRIVEWKKWRKYLNNPFKPVVDELANIKNCRALLFFACSFKSRKVWHWLSE